MMLILVEKSNLLQDLVTCNSLRCSNERADKLLHVECRPNDRKM